MYEVTTSLKLTVLLSGSKACIPVLGIYKGSHLNDTNLPCGLEFMLNYYRERIDSSFADKDISLYYEAEWKDLINGIIPSSVRGLPILPLTTSNWKQGAANDNDYIDAYNFFIEDGDDCNHCLAGCVAVAMG